MGRRIHIDLDPAIELEIDGAAVAAALGLDPTEFRRLMEGGRIVQLCERGTGEDAGLYRTTFYCQGKRARMVIDREGRIVGHIET